MSIELKLVGNHATDLVAQIQMLAEMFGVATVLTETDNGKINQRVVSTAEIYADKPIEEKVEIVNKVETNSLSEKLNRKEQEAAVEEMIAAKKKDARFDLLAKSRQNTVENALTVSEPEAVEEVASDVDYMFEDEPKSEVKKGITREDVSMLMAEIAKDNEKALKVRAVLVENIPAGQDIKVRNIPENKVAAVYAALKKMED